MVFFVRIFKEAHTCKRCDTIAKKKFNIAYMCMFSWRIYIVGVGNDKVFKLYKALFYCQAYMRTSTGCRNVL